ncbi:MAG TPA: nucleoside deaminase [Candidatus Obscuribacterales bacterium]
MSDELMMNLALEEARGCGDDVPIGCIIVKDGQIIARGANQRERRQDPIGHAELIALRQAAEHLGKWRLDGCIIYCTLEPCPMCAEAILQSRVSEVVFGAYDQMYGAMGSAFNLYVKGRPFPLPEVRGGIMQQECRKLVQDFFKRRRAENEGAPK